MDISIESSESDGKLHIPLDVPLAIATLTAATIKRIYNEQYRKLKRMT